MNQKILGITTDSRKVKPGYLFIAYKGVFSDGHDFIPQAIKNGAIAVIGEKNIEISVPYHKVKNGRLAWANAIADWYGNPEKKLKFIGITGTDGKTTTSNLIFEILKSSGKKVGLVSTINAKIAGCSYDTGLHVTSPDPDELWKFLNLMVKKKVEYAVLEATSHALVQDRFGGINFEIGVLTNLAHDHLEFHKTIYNYKKAKGILFAKSKTSIINKNCTDYDYFKAKSKGEAIPYSINKEIKKIQYILKEKEYFQEFQLKYKNSWVRIRTSLLGDYNLENILAASKAAEYLGIKKEQVVQGIEKLKQLEGRFNVIPNKIGLHLVVDFAHTEQGIRNVTALVKNRLRQKNEKIILVFGCNGERDRSKRAPMGKVGIKSADYLVITAEDPRKEDISQIFSDIEKGCQEAGGKFGENYFRVDDRREAIEFAINKIAKKNDWILFLGKGHERSMNIRGIEYPWNEAKEVRKRAKKSFMKKVSS